MTVVTCAYDAHGELGTDKGLTCEVLQQRSSRHNTPRAPEGLPPALASQLAVIQARVVQNRPASSAWQLRYVVVCKHKALVSL